MKDKWRRFGRYFLGFVAGVIISCFFSYWAIDWCLKFGNMQLAQCTGADLMVLNAIREGKSESVVIKLLEGHVNKNIIALSCTRESELNKPGMQAFIAYLVEYRKKYPREPMEEPYETQTCKRVDKFLEKYKNIKYGVMKKRE